jgi:hypothetical protein
MGVPTSEVGYNPAMPRREDHEVYKRICGGTGGGGYCLTITVEIFLKIVILAG